MHMSRLLTSVTSSASERLGRWDSKAMRSLFTHHNGIFYASAPHAIRTENPLTWYQSPYFSVSPVLIETLDRGLRHMFGGYNSAAGRCWKFPTVMSSVTNGPGLEP